MKKIIFTLIIVLVVFVFVESSAEKISDNPDKILSTIDALDTVVFDMSQAVTSGGFVEFPVSILSDDSVFSLDFSFKYNHANLIYDSIFDLTTYMLSLSYYNTNDSTVRFTSSSFQKCGNDSSLVLIRFALLSGHIQAADLNTITALMNGVSCSYKVIDFISTGIPENSGDESSLSIYPNPVSEKLNVEIPENGIFQLYNISGQIINQSDITSNQKLEFNTSDFSNGIYIVKVVTGTSIMTRKILIDNDTILN